MACCPTQEIIWEMLIKEPVKKEVKQVPQWTISTPAFSLYKFISKCNTMTHRPVLESNTHSAWEYESGQRGLTSLRNKFNFHFWKHKRVCTATHYTSVTLRWHYFSPALLFIQDGSLQGICWHTTLPFIPGCSFQIKFILSIYILTLFHSVLNHHSTGRRTILIKIHTHTIHIGRNSHQNCQQRHQKYWKCISNEIDMKRRNFKTNIRSRCQI
jgi:hypothetical protein